MIDIKKRAIRKSCNVFGYGSLMDSSEVARTIGSSTTEAKSKMELTFLRNWKRSYSRPSTEWGGNVLNIEPCLNKVVNGVLIVGLTSKQLDAIKERERGYSIKRVMVKTEKMRKVLAYTFVVDPIPGKVSKRYAQLVEHAASSYGTEFYQLFKQSF